MKRLWLALALAAAGWGQDIQAVVQQGEAVFAKTCATGYCHGPKGAPGGAPRLAARGFDQAFIGNTVARGMQGTGMPAFAMTLSRSDLVAVIAYVATLNGIARPAVTAPGAAAGEPASPAMSAGALRGKALFSDAVRGFGRCSTCHELNGIGIPVATPIAAVPADAQALKSLATPQVVTATAAGDSMPALPVRNTNRGVVFYDLTTAPPVLRTMDSGAVSMKDGSSWKHSAAIASYSDAELGSILEYLRAVNQ